MCVCGGGPHLQHVQAQHVEGQVIEVAAKGLLQLQRDTLNTQQAVANETEEQQHSRSRQAAAGR